MNDQYLRPMLDAGSSRVFNCNDRARKLMKEKAENPYFFKLPKLHGLILIKEAMLHASPGASRDRAVGTKLYVPYNQEDVYEGGRSSFCHTPRLLQFLNDLFGLRGAGVEDADVGHDLRILGILDRLPSLDGFLMRDALELDGIKVNESYFEVSEEERAVIHQFVRRKFEPLVERACGERSAPDKVNQLIDKVWEAKDKAALAPLISAFRFPEDEALRMFAAWKGINFYTFEYERGQPQREKFALWLRDGALPRSFLAKGALDYLKQLRRTTTERLRETWNTLESITREYETLYERFLKTPDGVGDFLRFLRRSHEIYWQMGDSLSKISHAIHCWKCVTVTYADRSLPAEKLAALLEALQLVLAGGGERVESAVVWQ